MDTCDFEVFWKLYPCKEDKKNARIAFEKQRGKVTMEELLAGVERYKAFLRANEWRKPKYAQGWLNGERWTDEYGQQGCDDFEMRAHKRSQIGVNRYQ